MFLPKRYKYKYQNNISRLPIASQVRVKPLGAKLVHTARALPGFRSMKPTRSITYIHIATPPGWDASPSQVTAQHFVTGTHLYSWVERGTVRVNMSCQRTQHNDPGQGLNVQRTNHLTIASPTRYLVLILVTYKYYYYNEIGTSII